MNTALRLAVLAFAVLWAHPSFACSCDRSITSKILDFVPVAFAGKVISVERIPSDIASPLQSGIKTEQRTTFQIVNVIKGKPSSPAQVFTIVMESMCGYDFNRELGKTLIVPVHVDDDGRMTTSFCHMIDINGPKRR
jgi:hypothetical protein